MKILGIETSCDETGAAIIEAKPGNKKVKLLSNIVTSSLILHSKTGGIIPEIAAREQVKYIIPVIEEALRTRHSGKRRGAPDGASRAHPESLRTIGDSGQARMTNIDAIAVTVGPGLIGSLLVGVETAKTLSYVWQKPIIPVNHLIGHIYANFVDPEITLNLSLRAKRSNLNGIATSSRSVDMNVTPRNDKITFPALALIVSGGHTDLVLVRKHGSIKWLGGTRDDAAGEAFDKIGRLLGLPYPGGPAIENTSERGDASRFHFPRPMIDSKDFDFSFSGLKTAVSRHVILNKVKNPRDPSASPQDDIILSNICASVQQAVIDVLLAKTLKAAQKYKVKSILLGGGVAANQKLRDQFALEIRNLKLEILLSVPQKYLCTDNGAMIATAAFFNYKPVPWPKLTANPELYFD